ncbi:MAG TPA: hypothetical protein VIQ60_07865 [Gemmatimonadaceae bacterium]
MTGALVKPQVLALIVVLARSRRVSMRTRLLPDWVPLITVRTPAVPKLT